MPMDSCSDCGSAISYSAKTCPYCGGITTDNIDIRTPEEKNASNLRSKLEHKKFMEEYKKKKWDDSLPTRVFSALIIIITYIFMPFDNPFWVFLKIVVIAFSILSFLIGKDNN